MEQRGTSRNPTGGFGFTVKCRNRDTVSLIKSRDTVSMINGSAGIETPFP
jgi:hypothetical protein